MLALIDEWGLTLILLIIGKSLATKVQDNKTKLQWKMRFWFVLCNTLIWGLAPLCCEEASRISWEHSKLRSQLRISITGHVVYYLISQVREGWYVQIIPSPNYWVILGFCTFPTEPLADCNRKNIFSTQVKFYNTQNTFAEYKWLFYTSRFWGGSLELPGTSPA